MESQEKEPELDIDEIQSILGLEGKTKEISELFSNSPPNNFLQAISLISNSNKFNENTQTQETNDSNLFPDFKNIIINSSNFFMAENSDKYEITFPKPSKKKEKSELPVIKITEIKENKNVDNNNIKPEDNNNINNNNQNQNKEDKKQKQKNKKKKKKKKKKQKQKNSLWTKKILLILLLTIQNKMQIQN